MIKKNYIRFNSDGFKEKYNLKRIIATSENVDILYCFADFDTDLEETAYRVFARIERADNKVIGPQLLPLSSVALTLEEVEFLGVMNYAVYNDEAVDDKVYNVACRKLELKDNATSIVGDLSISIVYQEVDAGGKVINVAVNESVVIPVYKAVKQLAEEDEWNTIKEEMLPRDLGDIITSLQDNKDADKVLGRQDGDTLLFTLANLRKYIEKHNVVNLGDIVFSWLDNIINYGVYRFEVSDGSMGDAGLLIVEVDDDHQVKQLVVLSDRVKYRSANNVAFTDFVFKNEKEKLEALHQFIHNVSTGLSAKVDSQGNRIGSLETWKDNTATPALNDALSKSLGGTILGALEVLGQFLADDIRLKSLTHSEESEVPINVLNPLKYNNVIVQLSDALNDGTIVDAKWVKNAIQNSKIDLFETVSELPEVGVANRIYFVIDSLAPTGNVFKEYAWIDDGWELLGSVALDFDIDLDEYIKEATADSKYVAKVSGKGLSTNDFDNTYKDAIDNLKPVATSGDYEDLSNKPTIINNLPILYGNIINNADVVNKTVLIPDEPTPFVNYIKDQIYIINFANGNTAVDMTLNINNKGAKDVYYPGVGSSSGVSKGSYIYNNMPLHAMFVYDGAKMVCIGYTTPLNTANRIILKNFMTTYVGEEVPPITAADSVLDAIKKIDRRLTNIGNFITISKSVSSGGGKYIKLAEVSTVDYRMNQFKLFQEVDIECLNATNGETSVKGTLYINSSQIEDKSELTILVGDTKIVPNSNNSLEIAVKKETSSYAVTWGYYLKVRDDSIYNITYKTKQFTPIGSILPTYTIYDGGEPANWSGVINKVLGRKLLLEHSTDIDTDKNINTKTVSPKAVYTYVDDIVGDIESILDSILGV